MAKKKSWEEENAFTGETPPCPNCGTPLTKRYVFSGMYCESCHYCESDNYDDDDDDDDDDDELDERLSVWDAAEIWASHGKDGDYTFGYSEQELEDAL